MVGGMKHDPSTQDINALLREQALSGLSVAAFARERGISSWRLYHARRKARARTRPSEAEFAPVTVVGPGPSPSRIEITLPGGVEVHVPHGSDADEVARLVHALVRC